MSEGCRRAVASGLWLLPALLVLIGTSGCVTTTVIQTGAVAAETTDADTPDGQLLDVGIIVFDPGVPVRSTSADADESDDADGEEAGATATAEGGADGEAGAEGAVASAQGEPSEKASTGKASKNKPRVSRSVREAEARYIPYVLSETMQQTGYWGAVRVIPSMSNSVDVTVEGQILHSDGERLVLHVVARDATGRVWLNREYDHIAGKLAYRESLNIQSDRLDPFQDMYNLIANDLVAAMDGVTPKERESIRQVAELRFAEDLAPEAFGDFLREEDGMYSARRLPAYSDPMVARMRRIREREYFFFDTLDEHFKTFATEMDVPYDEWRKYTYDEVVTLRELQR
ncbi:MAG: hypothetical protein AAFX85_17810, partial [Pseudomonadota bacterium]